MCALFAYLQVSLFFCYSCFREERYEFIRAKYVEKKYITRTCVNEQDLLSDLEHAVNNRDLHHLLQVYAENVDLSASLPTSVSFRNIFFSFRCHYVSL